MRIARRLSAATVCALSVLLGGIAAKSDELPAIPVTPEQTKVLLLPTLDQTGDRADMQKEHVDFGNHRLEYEFLIRHFQVMGPAMAIRAARSEDFDITDDDSRTKSAMKKLGTDTGADWVVSVAVIEVKSTNARFGNKRAQGKVKLRIFDMKQDGWIADRFFQDHKDSFGNAGTTGLFRAALDTTVQRSTANLLDSYPKIVKVYDEFGQDDYLPGQTMPYLADPTKTFIGLKPGDPATLPTSSVPAAPPAPATPIQPPAPQPTPAPATLPVPAVPTPDVPATPATPMAAPAPVPPTAQVPAPTPPMARAPASTIPMAAPPSPTPVAQPIAPNAPMAQVTMPAAPMAQTPANGTAASPASPTPAPSVSTPPAPASPPVMAHAKPTPPKAVAAAAPDMGTDGERQIEAAVLAHMGKKVDWHKYSVNQMYDMEQAIKAKK